MNMRRIVVMQQASSREQALLRAVAEAAARLDSELTGLFVEDIDLLNLAALPFSCEVCFPSATRRELDLLSMERSLRRMAEEARHALETIARQAALRSSFRVARGSLLAELLAAASETDIVVAGPLKRGHKTSAITVVCMASVKPQTVADLLKDLAPRMHGDIVIALLGSSEEFDPWEKALRDAIKIEGIARRLRIAAPADERELEKLLRG